MPTRLWNGDELHAAIDADDEEFVGTTRGDHGAALIDVLSPNEPANLDADRAAFAALVRHLKQTDYGLNFGGKGSLLRVTMGSY